MARKQRQTKTVKIEDVAATAGVSIMTVSRAMRGVEGVSEAKRLQIMEIAAKLGYTPNPNASSLVGLHSALIGISFPNLFNDVFADILEGLRPTFEKRGFTTVVNTTEYDFERERAWVERVRSWRPAAMILTGTDHDDDIRSALVRDQIPTLEVWDYSESPIDISVGIDHVSTGRDIANAMIELGYQQPGFVGFARGFDLRAEKRLRGIREAFQQAGLGDVRAARSETTNGYKAGYDGFQSLWSDARSRPDLVFFLSDHFAFAGLMACQANGISVPEEVGMVGFNSLNITGVLPTKLTTVITPRREMGVRGAQALIARMNGIKSDLSVKLDPKIIYGATTRSPNPASPDS